MVVAGVQNLNGLDVGPDGRAVRVRDPEAYQARAREGDLHLRRRTIQGCM